jgi:hypothetical protein
MPETLTVQTVQIQGVRPGWVSLSGYHKYDSTSVTDEVFELLPHFDGRATGEIVAELATKGVEMDADLLRALVDLGILG